MAEPGNSATGITGRRLARSARATSCVWGRAVETTSRSAGAHPGGLRGAPDARRLRAAGADRIHEHEQTLTIRVS